VGDCAFSAEIPLQWEQVPPKNSFRLAQWKFKGSEDSEVVIFYLPIGTGKDGPDAQLDRWEGEFSGSWDGGGPQA